jgi:hypothetical protein
VLNRDDVRVSGAGAENVLIERGKQAHDGMRTNGAQGIDILGPQVPGAAFDVHQGDPCTELVEPAVQPWS